jgi:ubiquinone/menaquinone biosynthesis C-methylase UbiE
MNNALREAWTTIVRPDDYETHMATIGQAQANAKLVEEYFAKAPLNADDSILFMGAGTGQVFNFVSHEFLLPYQTTFSDINAAYLKWLSERLKNAENLRFETVVDDVEQSRLTNTFPLVLAVLLLEHVDWHKAVATLCKLSSKTVFVVIQENPPNLPTAYTANRPGTMKIFAEVHPTLIPSAELEAEFNSQSFRKNYAAERTVADGKKMLALGFERS